MVLILGFGMSGTGRTVSTDLYMHSASQHFKLFSALQQYFFWSPCQGLIFAFYTCTTDCGANRAGAGEQTKRGGPVGPPPELVQTRSDQAAQT
jgi:hypothetical protein